MRLVDDDKVEEPGPKHRRRGELYSDGTRWHRLSSDDAHEIGEHLAGLPSTVRDDDETAKRFDLLVLRVQLCVLSAEPGFERLRDQIRDIASALLEVVNIPAVAAQQQLLDAVAGEEWWIDVTLPMLELLRRRVRSLVRLVPKARRHIVYTDFEDQLGETIEVTLAGLPVGTDLRCRSSAVIGRSPPQTSPSFSACSLSPARANPRTLNAPPSRLRGSASSSADSSAWIATPRPMRSSA